MADPNDLMEEIDLESDELEEVENRLVRFDYPVVTITRDHKYFFLNSASQRLFAQFNRVRIFTTPQYIILSDAKGEIKNTFSFKKQKDKQRPSDYSWYVITLPAALKEKKLKPGYYKLYKCKQGFAFKRYEPLEVQNAAS